MDRSLKSNLCTQFPMIQKSRDAAGFVLSIKFMQVKRSWSQNSRPDQKCSGTFPSWLKQFSIHLIPQSHPISAHWMQRLLRYQLHHWNVERGWQDPLTDKSPVLFIFKCFSSPCMLPYKVLTFLLSIHIPRLSGKQLKDQLNKVTPLSSEKAVCLKTSVVSLHMGNFTISQTILILGSYLDVTYIFLNKVQLNPVKVHSSSMHSKWPKGFLCCPTPNCCSQLYVTVISNIYQIFNF